MGAFCCCFHVQEEQNSSGSNNSTSKDCLCLNCCINNFMNKHENPKAGSIGTSTGLSAPAQQAASLDSAVVFGNSTGQGMSHSEAMPINSGSRNLEEQGQEKGNSSRVAPAPCEETESLLNSKSTEGIKIADMESLYQNSKSSGTAFVHPSPDDEDVCPTCLEEYTIENPKITTKCFHHYHLSCIYEWMERNANCPVCGEVMLFDESS